MRIESGARASASTWTPTRFRSKRVSRSRAISTSKGCYVGQEVIIRVLHRGHGRVAKRLVGLTLDAARGAGRRRERSSSGEREDRARHERGSSPALARPHRARLPSHRDFVEPATWASSCRRRAARRVVDRRATVTSPRSASRSAPRRPAETPATQLAARHPAHLLSQHRPRLVEAGTRRSAVRRALGIVVRRR